VTRVRIANSQYASTSGEIMLNISIAGRQFTHKFVVIDGLPKPVIVGTDFLRGRCTLNFIDNLIQFADGGTCRLYSDNIKTRHPGFQLDRRI